MSVRSLLFSIQNILAAAEGSSPLGPLSREPRRILTYVAAQVADGAEICIGDVTGCEDLGAPLTVSRRLRDLEAGRWIEIVGDPQNHRRRLIKLTDLAQSTLDEVALHVERDLNKVLSAQP